MTGKWQVQQREDHGAWHTRWALDTLVTCLELDWPAELLDHELGEAVGVSLLMATATGSATERSAPQQQLLFRGLRLKWWVHGLQ